MIIIWRYWSLFLDQNRKIDWGSAPDTSSFLGRYSELERLKNLILQEKSRLVAIIGIGGVGKSLLSAKLAKDISSEFDYIIWRNLFDRPTISEILADLYESLSIHQEFKKEDFLDKQISQLVNFLRNNRCLIILDNAESILKAFLR